MSVRRAIVNRLGRVVALPTLWALRLSKRRIGIALGYHRIGDPEGDRHRELVPKLASARFERHLRHLRRHYRPVSASQLRDAVQERRRGGRIPVAVTFDDDLGSHAEVAMPILRRADVSATFFVCGASLERPFSFWWERLQRAVDQGAVAGRPIHEVATSIQMATVDEREAEAARLLELGGPDPPDAGLRAAALRELVTAGFEVGFHTLRHHDLRRLDDEHLGAALDEGREELERVTGRPLRLIAYPHGGGDVRVAATARMKGYDEGFTMDPEPVTPASDPLLMGRFEPGFGPTSRFALDLVRVLRRG
jgi:peptidoglycan/xylan/chitin deacetylase (PgdA/CDA1 family)